MRIITLQINDDAALEAIRALESTHSISIIDNSNFNSSALRGKPMSVANFKKWIADAENSPTYSFDEFMAKWEIRKKQIQSLI